MYNQLQSLTIIYSSQYNSCMRLKGAPLRVLWPLCIWNCMRGGGGLSWGASTLRVKCFKHVATKLIHWRLLYFGSCKLSPLGTMSHVTVTVSKALSFTGRISLDDQELKKSFNIQTRCTPIALPFSPKQNLGTIASRASPTRTAPHLLLGCIEVQVNCMFPCTSGDGVRW